MVFFSATFLFHQTHDNFQKLFSAYFHNFSNIAYKNNLAHMQKQYNFILFFSIEIAYVSLYISSYHDNSMCHKLQISCLSKQAHDET